MFATIALIVLAALIVALIYDTWNIWRNGGGGRV